MPLELPAAKIWLLSELWYSFRNMSKVRATVADTTMLPMDFLKAMLMGYI